MRPRLIAIKKGKQLPHKLSHDQCVVLYLYQQIIEHLQKKSVNFAPNLFWQCWYMKKLRHQRESKFMELLHLKNKRLLHRHIKKHWNSCSSKFTAKIIQMKYLREKHSNQVSLFITRFLDLYFIEKRSSWKLLPALVFNYLGAEISQP